MNQKAWIPNAIVSLLLAAGLVLYYAFKDRWAGEAPTSSAASFVAAVERGTEAFEKGDFVKAGAAWDEAVRIDPNHSEAHRWRGDAWLNQRKNDEALSEYEKALQLNPNNAMAYVSQGMAWTEKREGDNAIAAFERAIELRPELANMPHYQRYALVADSLRSNSQNPKFNDAVKRGLEAFGKKNYAEAILDFDEAIRLEPDHSDVRRWRGDAYLYRREFDTALSAYEDAIRLNPKNSLAYLGSGMAWTEKRESGPALVAFETAIGLDPKLAKRPAYKRYLAAAESLRPLSPDPDKK